MSSITNRNKPLEAQEFARVYTEYEDALKRSKLLDYDDLLLRCVDLLREHPSCVSNVEAVLIDEFQDTNLVQFDLMSLFAAHKKKITIVGDPDQSIYGFRAAEIKNLVRMQKQYTDTLVINLEQNYRSSGAILLLALEVIRQDEARPAKPLLPTHCVGTRPVLRKLPSAITEASWIVNEIKRTVALTGGMLTLNDVAILIRSATLSRHIESALGNAGISYRMVGGHRFFDRVEVKITLDYLRTIAQPENNDSLARIINVPGRKIGDTTLNALMEEAETKKVPLWDLILNSVQCKKTLRTKLTKQAEQGLAFLVNLILNARKKMSDSGDQDFSLVDLMHYVVKRIALEQHLEKTYPDDHESRWANVEELIRQASESSEASAVSNDEDLPAIEGVLQEQNANKITESLSQFLANVALSSEIQPEGESEASQAQVTISTIHAAKGLEWPVVFIPAAYDGSIPHSRADDIDEERRLLYVAMTRAKALLYICYPLKNSQGGMIQVIRLN
jgi:DNA helicase-2/ATP-dependent DNA helicase PcrA